MILHPSHVLSIQPCMTELHRTQVGIRLTDKVKFTFLHKHGEVDYIGTVGPAPQEYVDFINASMTPVVMVSTCFAAMLNMPNPMSTLESFGNNLTPRIVLSVLMQFSIEAQVEPLVDIWADEDKTNDCSGK